MKYGQLCDSPNELLIFPTLRVFVAYFSGQKLYPFCKYLLEIYFSSILYDQFRQNNKMNTLSAISPIDGRYRKTTKQLADYFSEASLIKYRVRVEVEYFIALCQIPLPQLKAVDKKVFPKLFIITLVLLDQTSL